MHGCIRVQAGAQRALAPLPDNVEQQRQVFPVGVLGPGLVAAADVDKGHVANLRKWEMSERYFDGMMTARSQRISSPYHRPINISSYRSAAHPQLLPHVIGCPRPHLRQSVVAQAETVEVLELNLLGPALGIPGKSTGSGGGTEEWARGGVQGGGREATRSWGRRVPLRRTERGAARGPLLARAQQQSPQEQCTTVRWSMHQGTK